MALYIKRKFKFNVNFLFTFFIFLIGIFETKSEFVLKDIYYSCQSCFGID